MPDPTAIAPILPFPRMPASGPVRGPAGLVAARVGGVTSPLSDRIDLSAAAAKAGGSLSPFRTAADRMEAATGVARGRLVDRLA